MRCFETGIIYDEDETAETGHRLMSCSGPGLSTVTTFKTQREREILITRAAKVSMDGRVSAICCHRDRVINSVPILFELFSHNPSVCGA